MKKSYYLYLAMVVIGLLIIGCSERTNPLEFPKINDRGNGNDGVYTYPRAFQQCISEHAGWEFFNFTESKAFIIKCYTPVDFRPDIQNEPRPILYLLHDFTGDQNFYFSHMVQRIADSLTYLEEIKPFYIATVDASTPYGGSWYTDNEFFGHFEEMITTDFITFLEQVAGIQVIERRSSRAIGGFGMGGYGALKLAAKHPELYSSVSTSNCAGIFDFSENWCRDLAANVFQELGLTTPVANFTEAFDNVEISHSTPYTMLAFSMAQAFSPHPLDETHANYDLLNDDTDTYLPYMGVHLPFDENGNIYTKVWELWLENDLDGILTANADHFDSLDLYMEYSDADQFQFNGMAQEVMSLCDQLGIEYSSDSYSGYSGYDASGQRFVYDRLVEILKFHSKKLDHRP